MEKGEYDTKRKPVESKSSKTELQGSTQTASEASSSRPHKLQKLDELKRKHPFVTQSALSSLVSEFKKEGLPQLSSRKHQSEAKKLASSGEAYGPLIRKVSLSCCDGESISLEVVNYLTFLALAFQSGGALYEGLCKAFAAGCSYDQPFKLLLYSDEIVPGNPLGHTLSRKVWVFYASIVELGGSNLQKEIAWQCLCICRSSLVSKLQAGVSQIFAAILKIIFCGDFNPSVGLTLKGPDGQHQKLFLSFGGMLQDGAANKFAWSIKGDAGSRFCILCKNLFAKTSLIMQDGEEILTSSMHKAHGLKFASNQDIKSSIARLQRKKLEYTAEAFKDWEQACGFVYQEKSLLLDPDLQHVLNPANNFVHDWMHAILANGIMATILTLLLKTLEESKEFDAHDTFGNYLQKWTFPKALKLQPHSLFSKKRKKSNQEANTFKATASEFLGMYAILSFFMQTVLIPAKHCVEACNVFIELGNLLDILQAIPICSITPAHLQTAVEAFFDAVETAHWVDSFHSKFHWLVHLPAELEYLKCLPSCFCLERKHKAVKKFAQATSNLKNYEAGVLMDVVAQELYDLKERPGIFLGAIALEHHGLPTKYFKELISKYFSFTECFTCSTLLLQPAGKACKGDFITWCEGEKIFGGQICMHIEVDGKIWSLVSVWAFQSYKAAICSANWTKTDDTFLVEAALISQPMSWKESKGVLTSLVPLYMRHKMPQ